MSLLPPNYGYVFATVGGSYLLNLYLMIQVAVARKKYKVEYPNLYAPLGHKNEVEFNSVQRAHQNTLESFTFVVLQICLCGLVYPITSSIFGVIWILGRFIYGYGYANQGPNGRYFGGIISHIGDFPLTFLLFKIAYDMITKV